MQIKNIKKRAIVLGANGFLGKNLCFFLLNAEYEIIAVGRQVDFVLKQYLSKTNLHYIKADLNNLNQVKDIPFAWADVIYMMAGKNGTIDGFENYDDYVKSNDLSLLNVLAIYREKKAMGRIVYPSTRLVYQGSDQPLTENDSKNPKTVYAINKLACEQYLQACGALYKLPFTVMRISVPFGSLVPSQYSYGTIGTLLNQAMNARQITVFGDGLQKRTFIHTEDLCHIFEAIWKVKKTSGEIFNIGGSDHLSMIQVAHYFSAQFSALVTYRDWPADYWAIESGSTELNDQKLQTVCKYKYSHTLQDYVAKL